MSRMFHAAGHAAPNTSERGSALILFTFLCGLLVIPLIGLAIDGSVLYWTKAKLSSAVDAAALAAARSLTLDASGAAQQSAAQVVATNYLNANFPPGWLGTSLNLNSFAVQDGDPSKPQFKVRTVTMSVSATVPLYFARIMNFSTATIAASGQASRRDLNLMLVLDRTGSIEQAHVCGTMINAAQNFVSMFTDGRDTVGLVTFMASANLDYAPKKTFKSSTPSLNDTLSKLVCANNTGSAEAFSLAYLQMKQMGEVGALNVIVFFTDGHPNTVTANLPILNTNSTCAGSPQAFGRNSDGERTLRGIVYGSSRAGIYQTWVDPSGNIVPNSSGPPAINNGSAQPRIPNAGCSFSGSSNSVVAYLPDMDAWGNSTSDNGYSAVLRYPGTEGDGNMRDGHIRIDDVTTLENAAINAVDDAARKARTDPLGIVVYTVGLGDNSSDLPDTDLLQRMANDPANASYDPSQPSGRYIYVSNAAALTSAFQQIASQVLRLSQ